MRSWTRTSIGFLRLVLLVVLVVLLHLTLIRRIYVLGVGPDLSIILLVYISLWRGATGGTLGGFIIGLLQGLSSPFHFGAHALAKSVVGFGAGKLAPHIVRESYATQAAMIVGAYLVHDLILLPLTMDGVGSFFLILGTRTLPSALYSAVVGCLLYRVVLKPIGMDLTSHGAAVF